MRIPGPESGVTPDVYSSPELHKRTRFNRAGTLALSVAALVLAVTTSGVFRGAQIAQLNQQIAQLETEGHELLLPQMSQQEVTSMEPQVAHLRFSHERNEDGTYQLTCEASARINGTIITAVYRAPHLKDPKAVLKASQTFEAVLPDLWIAGVPEYFKTKQTIDHSSMWEIPFYLQTRVPELRGLAHQTLEAHPGVQELGSQGTFTFTGQGTLLSLSLNYPKLEEETIALAGN